LTSAELDKQFEDLFEGVVDGLPGSVADNGSPPAVSSQLRRGSVLQSMVQRGDVLDTLDVDFGRRTIRARCELQVFENLGNPESFRDNASRLQDKLDRLRQLQEEEFGDDFSAVVKQAA